MHPRWDDDTFFEIPGGPRRASRPEEFVLELTAERLGRVRGLCHFISQSIPSFSFVDNLTEKLCLKELKTFNNILWTT